ncbi:MAG: PorT family protein [Gemmatimonadota bacterium]|nr:PorT family protein [Gemmatimonadota bacterium]
MERMRIWLAAIVLAAVAVVPRAAEAQTVELIAQIGATIAQYTGDNITSGTEAQVSAGAKLRVGSGFYVDGGIFWTRTGGEIDGDAITLSSVRFPVTVGLRVIRASVVDLRLFAGTAINAVSSVADNSAGITKDDVKSAIWAGRAGIGVDIALIAIDLAYEFGLSDVFESGVGLDGVKQNAVVLEAGLRFGF